MVNNVLLTRAEKIKISNEEVISYYNDSSIYVKPASKDFYHLLFDDEFAANRFISDLKKEKCEFYSNVNPKVLDDILENKYSVTKRDF